MLDRAHLLVGDNVQVFERLFIGECQDFKPPIILNRFDFIAMSRREKDLLDLMRYSLHEYLGKFPELVFVRDAVESLSAVSANFFPNW